MILPVGSCRRHAPTLAAPMGHCGPPRRILASLDTRHCLALGQCCAESSIPLASLPCRAAVGCLLLIVIEPTAHMYPEKQQLPRMRRPTLPSSTELRKGISSKPRPTRRCMKSLSKFCVTMGIWTGRHCRHSSWPSRCERQHPGWRRTINTTQLPSNHLYPKIRRGVANGSLWTVNSTAHLRLARSTGP